MNNTQKNLYKQAFIFKCVHDVHQQFKAQMSPFHILVEKQCYPHGCIYFQWKCKLLAKKKKCFRNFTKVGKECSNCKYFVEEKIHQHPEFICSTEDGMKFLEKFREFEEWIEDLKNKRVLCEGYVSEVKPEFLIYKKGGKITLSLRGFLVCFKNGYIDNLLFEDKFYLSISSTTQSHLLFRDGDSVEFQAKLLLNRGRFKFIKSGHFFFNKRGDSVPLKKNDILVALKTYTIQPNQPQKCLNCKYGILGDVETDQPGPRRMVICMQGVQNYNYCSIAILDKINGHSDQCVNSKWGNLSCKHIL